MTDPRPALSVDRRRLRRVRLLARLLDDAFKIPGTKFRVGWDGIIGLAPGIGDLLTMGVSLYLIYEAYRLGASRRTLAAMGTNVAIDTLVGAIPAIGDVFDVAWKANRKNVQLLERHLAHHTADRDEMIRPRK